MCGVVIVDCISLQRALILDSGRKVIDLKALLLPLLSEILKALILGHSEQCNRETGHACSHRSRS